MNVSESKNEEHVTVDILEGKKEEHVTVNIENDLQGASQSRSEAQASTPYLIPGSIVLAGIIIAGAVIYSNGGFLGTPRNAEPPAAAGLEVQADDVVLGNAKAKVTIIEYGDYQCPYCAKFFAEVEPAIKEKYVKTGKAKFIFRSFQFLGPESGVAAEAVSCAQDQGKFWEYHDAIFTEEYRDGQEHNGNLNRELFLKLAESLGLNKEQFSSCVDEKKYATKVGEDRTRAGAVGVDSTPTTFVNGVMVKGAVPIDQISAVIDAELKK
ncbi:MAG: DsbA family protein [Patescibacteria group bacterium]